MAWVIGKADDTEIKNLLSIGVAVEIIDEDVALIAIHGHPDPESKSQDRWIRFYLDCDASEIGQYSLGKCPFEKEPNLHRETVEDGH